MTFGSARLNVVRANEHIVADEELVDCWLDSDAYTIRREINPEAGLTFHRAKIKGAPPPRLSILAGDALQNLRSALDHAVYAVAASQPGGVLPENERALMFPVVANENSKGQPADGADVFDRLARRTLPGIPIPVRDFIKQEQPYHWGDGYEHHWLWLIHDLNRIDKHRRLAVATTFLDFQFVSTPPGIEPRITFHRAEGPVKDGDPLVTYTGAEVGVNAHFTRGVSLNEGAAAGSGVEKLLRNLEDRVKWILHVMENLG